MRLVVLGGPGAGRGTQCELLRRQFGMIWISTGDILRKAIAAKDSDGDCQTELGRQTHQYVEQGELVPDELMIQFMRQRLLQPDVAKGWLLDGYPRTAFQAEELDFLLDEVKQQLDQAIYLEVPDDVLMQRSTARGRFDDQPESVQRRIELFRECTQPMLEYYELRDRLLRIDGNQSIEQVQQEILKRLGVIV